MNERYDILAFGMGRFFLPLESMNYIYPTHRISFAGGGLLVVVSSWRNFMLDKCLSSQSLDSYILTLSAQSKANLNC